VVITALALLVGVDAYLVIKERVAPSEQKARHLAIREDPLITLKYTRGNREANLTAFGFDADMTARALDRLRDLDDRHREKLRILLEQAPEPTDLADSICGQTNQVRPRYGAFRFFVAEDRGQRDPVRISRVSGLQWQDWSKVAPLSEVYAHTELAEDRKEDATRMSMAAVLVQKEEDLLNDYAPWGRGLVSTWSWKRLVEENPGITERLVETVALIHLSLEIAHGEGGLCGLDAED
jgi:hypothetical protein